MLQLTNTTIRSLMEWPRLIAALDDAFRSGAANPPRQQHEIPVEGEPAGTLLLMPAWTAGGYVGLKTVTVFPGNSVRREPAVNAVYLLLDARTGRPLATLEADELTARRTAAASALASSHLSRPDSRSLLVVGTGRLSPNLVEAHCAVRDIGDVAIWGRNSESAAAVAAAMIEKGIPARVGLDLEREARSADIISCCTLATSPLVLGDWLKPGCHLDLVGAFTPDMRETDDIAMTRGRIFVDTYEGATRESGEIVQAVRSGAITLADIRGDIAALVRGQAAGRTDTRNITVFKSVGCALEDLAAAVLCYKQAAG